jgi:cell division protein FtsZ
VTLGEVQIIMEELNRHINDQTQLFMGIGIEPRMGNRLSVSILSSLSNSAAKPVIQLPKKSAYALEPISRSEASIPAAISASPPIAALPDRTTTSERAPDCSSEELMIPRTESESQTPVPVRATAKPDSKTQATAPKKVEAKQETLQFEPISRGRFEKSEPTIIDGQDLDVPTFLRKSVKVR